MPRQATGQVVIRERRGGSVFALRFRANGERQYVTLGTDAEGWDERRAQEALSDELAKVRAGVWRPLRAAPAPILVPEQTFHEFATEWWKTKRLEVDESTRVDYLWQLSSHLLPFFAQHRLSDITVAEVDRYRNHKLQESAARAERLREWEARVEAARDRSEARRIRKERPPRALSATSINKTITRTWPDPRHGG